MNLNLKKLKNLNLESWFRIRILEKFAIFDMKRMFSFYLSNQDKPVACFELILNWNSKKLQWILNL